MTMSTTRAAIEERIATLDTLIFTPRDAARERTQLRQRLSDLDRAARRKAALALARAKDPSYDAKLAAAREAETVAAAALARSQAARAQRGRDNLDSAEARDALFDRGALSPLPASEIVDPAKAIATNVSMGIQAVPFGSAWLADLSLEEQLVRFQHSKARHWLRRLERWPFRLLEAQELEEHLQAGIDAHARRQMARGGPDPRLAEPEPDPASTRQRLRRRLSGSDAA